ncbi:hypothetical protein N7510_011185 [Penicillium lagena]|uniref:uncharacterized protein n=1 Tax=Penicillium lagena TaxID=94218 RepID=UPI002541309F|nr:uncharacterized protein N7510_011185 [Penicillium lagena]KAJ5601651.1 hypothetical protein N7510_011185 [Penicillium lagena]
MSLDWNENSFKKQIQSLHLDVIYSTAIHVLWRSFLFHTYHPFPFPLDFANDRIEFDAFHRSMTLLVPRHTDLLGILEGPVCYRRHGLQARNSCRAESYNAPPLDLTRYQQGAEQRRLRGPQLQARIQGWGPARDISARPKQSTPLVRESINLRFVSDPSQIHNRATNKFDRGSPCHLTSSFFPSSFRFFSAVQAADINILRPSSGISSTLLRGPGLISVLSAFLTVPLPSSLVSHESQRTNDIFKHPWMTSATER